LQGITVTITTCNIFIIASNKDILVQVEFHCMATSVAHLTNELKTRLQWWTTNLLYLNINNTRTIWLEVLALAKCAYEFCL
jgi:hypothetical protein